MAAKKNSPPKNFTMAREAIGNLLRPKLREFLSRCIEGLSVHTRIESAPISAKSGIFYSLYVPLLGNLISVLAESFRQYFALALAHPSQTQDEPHVWAWDQLQLAVCASLEWIRDWFMLACDGENQFLSRSEPIEPTSEQKVSLAIPIAATFPNPESWRAPAWLFGVSDVFFGVGVLKAKHIPKKDTEDRLGAAHTRLLLKGARKVFLRQLRTTIETVRNEELAKAGAIPTGPMNVDGIESKTRQRLGFEGLSQKELDLSRYMDNLTEKQRTAFSLRHEYRLGLTEVASRMGLDRKTAYEHIQAASRRIDQVRSNEKRQKNRAKSTPED
jgi:hypothetical protein